MDHQFRQSGQICVELDNLSRSFRGQKVIDNFSLTVLSDEFLTILGPSGCGKSTLLRIIAGLDRADQGRVIIDGKNMDSVDPMNRPVNMVFQNYALFPHLTVFENIAFGLTCKGFSKAKREVLVNEMITMVNLERQKERLPESLSGGEQQRVALARALVNKPLALLLDEPLSALDYSLRRKMQVELKTLQQNLRLSFIFVTHDQEEALSLSDRIVVMNENGIIEQIGTPRHIYENPSNLYVASFIGTINSLHGKVISTQEGKMGVAVENLRIEIPNRKGFAVGDKLTIIIRPEDLRAWCREEIENPEEMIPAKISQVVYRGSLVDLIAETDSGLRLAVTEFFDEDDEDLDFKIGERVYLTWTYGWESAYHEG